MRLFSNPLRLAGLLLPVLLLASPVAAEVFRLRDGGRIVGRLLNEDQVPRRDYTIELSAGGQITLAKDEVLERTPLRPNEEKYEKLRAECPDTVEGHWELAAWCLTNHLPSQRDAHLNRILELDPNHERARRALGYTRIDGAWQIRKEVMESQGLQLYRGRYRTKQEIEILQRDEKDQRTRNEWRGKMKRYSAWLDGAKHEQGR
ncbi:MAG: hypothetical protein GX621_15075, partial [Pirellulaceae bacterium]|nr:hypothetical protein [Pirellulaceae bacterium]